MQKLRFHMELKENKHKKEMSSMRSAQYAVKMNRF